MMLGEYKFTRNSQDNHDDIFHKVRRSTEIEDAIDSWVVNFTKKTCLNVRDVYKNPKNRGIWKAIGATFLTGVALATSSGTVAFKGGRIATKVNKGLFNVINDVFKEVKENL